MAENMAHGYSSESTQRELCDEYQQDRVYMVFKNLMNTGITYGWYVDFHISLLFPRY